MFLVRDRSWLVMERRPGRGDVHVDGAGLVVMCESRGPRKEKRCLSTYLVDSW